jgi:hypothetical protein
MKREVMPKELYDKSSTYPNPAKDAVVFFNFRALLTVYNLIRLQVDLQANNSPIVSSGEPFFPRVVDPRYRICGTNV